jgi:pimeloyl-ACP methyl ester carboxylesterase
VAERRALTVADATCPSFDGVPIAYTTAGTTGPTLVFIHGWSCRRTFWDEQLARAQTYRAIALDLGGRATASMTAFARDVEAVIDAAGADEVVLVGHSMGGAVGVEAALRLGARCRLLLGVDTFTDDRFYARRPPAEIDARLAAFAADYAGTMTQMVAQITAPATDARIVQRIAREMGDVHVDHALAALRALLDWDIAERWPLLTAPVATINATMLESPAHAITLDRLRVHLMDGTGHFPMLEAPDRFDTLLRAIVTPQHTSLSRDSRGPEAGVLPLNKLGVTGSRTRA